MAINREKVIKGLYAHGYKNCKSCPYWGSGLHDSSECKELAREALSLLREREPKTGHWIFESQYCEAWSHTCSECGKRMTTAVGTFANWCWNCGAKMRSEANE